MRYFSARVVQHNHEELYRIYVTDSLKIIGRIDQRYYDFIRPAKVETRTADEIISNIKEKLMKAGGGN